MVVGSNPTGPTIFSAPSHIQAPPSGKLRGSRPAVGRPDKRPGRFGPNSIGVPCTAPVRHPYVPTRAEEQRAHDARAYGLLYDLNIRADKDARDQAEPIFNELELNTATAIDMLLFC